MRRVLRLLVESCGFAMLAGCAAVAPPSHPMDHAGAAYALAVIPVSSRSGSDFAGRAHDETRALGE